jgi:hypothetical protein
MSHSNASNRLSQSTRRFPLANVRLTGPSALSSPSDVRRLASAGRRADSIPHGVKKIARQSPHRNADGLGQHTIWHKRFDRAVPRAL